MIYESLRLFVNGVRPITAMRLWHHTRMAFYQEASCVVDRGHKISSCKRNSYFEEALVNPAVKCQFAPQVMAKRLARI